MTRKIRSDSKLNGLPTEQRAKVDKWLFDKGMTYAQVVQACGEMFGLKVSRSSVARYYDRTMLERLNEERMAAAAGKPLDPKFEKMDNAQRYDWLMGWFLKQASKLAEWQLLEPDRKTARELCGMVKVLIAARKEKNQRMVVREVERPEFELWASEECLKEWRRQEKEKRPKRRRRGWSPEYDDIPWYE